MKENYDFDLFMETSAKSGFNAQELFCQCVKIIYDNFEKENKINSVNIIFFNFFQTIDEDLITILKNDDDNQKKKGKCCKN